MGMYNCRYCGKEIASFDCDCGGSETNIWKTHKKNEPRKKVDKKPNKIPKKVKGGKKK